MNTIWKETGKKIKQNYFRFFDDLSEHPKKYFVGLFLLLLTSLIMTFMMLTLPQRIREEQVNSLVYADIHSSKLQPLNLSDAKKIIEDRKAISVLFSVPDGKQYQELLRLFHNSKKMKELNRSIYFYPLVYEVAALEHRYNIKKEQITVIFFQNGKEANRLIVENQQTTDFSEELIPELNRLPLINIKKLSGELKSDQTNDSMQTKQSSIENY